MISIRILTISAAVLIMSFTAFPVTADAPLIVADSFSQLGPDGLPPGWALKQWFGGGHDIRIEHDGQKSVLHFISKKNSFGIYKALNFNVKDDPILTWRWMVTVLPDGGDVRNKHTDDQAAQVYVMFPRFPSMVNTRLVGYIWENKTPRGIQVTSQKSSNTRYVVLESGPEKLNQWIEERRNVYEDYKQLFGEEPPEVGGVTLMIDSDDTQSSAESYFDSIRFEKQ